MNARVWIVPLIAAMAAPLAAAELESGLVLHYDFDEGAGSVVRDRSGHGRDGKLFGCSFVPHGDGSALSFSGANDYVECTKAIDPLSENALSVSLWVRPQKLSSAQHGPVLLGSEDAWHLSWETSATAFSDCIWRIAGSPAASLARSWNFAPMDAWHHVAATYDGKELRIYTDAGPAQVYKSSTETMARATALQLGKQLPDAAEAAFLMDEVRVYDRALSETEIHDLLRTTNPSRDVEITVYPYRFADEIVVQLDVRGLTAHGRHVQAVTVALAGRRGGDTLLERRAEPLSSDRLTELRLPMSGLPPADYLLQTRAFDNQANQVGAASPKPFTWPRRPAWPRLKKAKVLNALVTELLSANQDKPASESRAFTNPRKGWVFFAASGKASGDDHLQLSLSPSGSDDPPLMELTLEHPAAEAMRLLPSGRYAIKVESSPHASLQRLVVRAIPELFYVVVPSQPLPGPIGRYDQDFLEKYIMPNVNVVAISQVADLAAWKSRGKLCIHETMCYGLGQWADATTQEYAQGLAADAGLANPLFDGLIGDEFPNSHGDRASGTAQALRQLWAPKYRNKRFDAYVYGGERHYGRTSEVRRFLETIVKWHGHFVHERYLQTPPTEPEARALLALKLSDMIDTARRAYPDAAQVTTINVGYFTAPQITLNHWAHVDYKVFLDMLFHEMANRTSSFGLYGLMTYNAVYADEEIVRWAARLSRHYCIEGRTERLSSDPYVLPHLTNGDFDHGLQGWTVEPARSGSIDFAEIQRFGLFRGNWGWGGPAGNRFVLLKRSDKGPNAISQSLSDLDPRRLYSLRFYSADYQDLLHTRSVKTQHAIAVALDGADLLPERCFQHVYESRDTGLGFDQDNPAWLNFHRFVFRPRTGHVDLTISDWTGPSEPGGPIGQELLVNYVQIQPYFDN